MGMKILNAAIRVVPRYFPFGGKRVDHSTNYSSQGCDQSYKSGGINEHFWPLPLPL